MEKRGTDRIDDLGVAETPEDVAVLYSWANLHGAKYRDFSASRREYRAQLRHRAAEQVRQQALLAQAEAEAAAEAAEATARKAADAARSHQGASSEVALKQNLRQAEEAARTAAAERVEAARRAEAAATAEAAARREEREIAEAHASAERQAARYAESEIRLREFGARGFRESQELVPGRISDPYTPQATSAPLAEDLQEGPTYPQRQTSASYQSAPAQRELPRSEMQAPSVAQPRVPTAAPSQQIRTPLLPPQVHTPRAQVVIETLPVRNDSSSSQRRPQGYHPDEASGVRQIYRGPDHDPSLVERRTTESGRHPAPSQFRADNPPPPRERRVAQDPPSNPRSDSQPASVSRSGAGSVGSGAGASGSGSSGGRQPFNAQATPPRSEAPRTEVPKNEAQRPEAQRIDVPARTTPLARAAEPSSVAPFWEHSRPAEKSASSFGRGYIPNEEPAPGSASAAYQAYPPARREPAPMPSARAVSPFSQPPASADTARGRRAQDDFRQGREQGYPDVSRPAVGSARPYPGVPQHSAAQPPRRSQEAVDASASGSTYSSDPAGPAWFYAPAGSEAQSQPLNPPPSLTSVAETLQHSRERVAARWFALKGVFEQPGDPVEPAPVRQKEIRTPVLAVFSLAGGVGKTSLVATIGRSLSSLGEKVLLTDTTSHGLLPFYFGASELRQGTVRTFSPPSGSTDAPIYLVSYEVANDSVEQDKETLVEEILGNSRGTHRIMLDLTVGSAWIIRQLARMSPTVLVPLAPDMNSVISLQAIEKFFQGMVDADGRPLQPYYLINQFDVSLPLHLDVREVLRRQLGDRLLPFVIHRAPEVSEALAEGMTVVDYAPESPVSGDYMNVATWLRTVAAPATAGFRNVRWSER